MIVGGVFGTAFLTTAPLQQTGGGIDWATVLRYVPEIALVIIILYYEERRSDRDSKARIERDTKQALEDERRDKEWREFLGQERDERKTVLTGIVSAVAAIAAIATTTSNQVATHDAWERETLSRQQAEKPR